MLGIQANLRPRPYTPRHYISRLQIAAEIMAGVVLCAIQGVVLAMLGYIGLGMARSAIGKVILPGLLEIPVKWLTAILPLSLAPYAGTLCLAGLLGMLGATFIHAAWTRTLTSSFMAPSQESNNMLYVALAYILPLGVLAFSLNTGLLATSTAFGVAASLSAVASSFWNVVIPTQENRKLWNDQKAMHEREAARFAEASHTDTVSPMVSPTPTSAPPAPSPTSAPTMTPGFDHARRLLLNSDSASKESLVEIVDDDLDLDLDDTDVGPPSSPKGL